MKYCLTYRSNKEQLMNKADELSINFNRSDTTLPEFLEKYRNKRIIINIDIENFTDEDMKLLKAIYEKQPIFTLKFSTYDKKFVKDTKEAHMPYFLSKLVNDWDTFNALIELGVSDIYIVEHLGFELDLCAEKAHAANIQLRAFPNIAQASWIDTPEIKKFFIRPEDVIQYEPYLDVLEFITTDTSKEGVLYDIYAIDKKWNGSLKEIISDCNIDISSQYIVPRFAENRIRCGKKCLKGSNCTICETIEHLAKTLEEQKIKVVMKKEEEE